MNEDDRRRLYGIATGLAPALAQLTGGVVTFYDDETGIRLQLARDTYTRDEVLQLCVAIVSLQPRSTYSSPHTGAFELWWG